MRNRTEIITGAWALCAAVFGIGAAGCALDHTPEAEDVVIACEMTPVMLEEFNDLSVSAWHLEGKRWIAHTPWAGDFGDAVFLDPGPDGPFSVKDGILSITAKKDANGRWTSGLLAAVDPSGAGTGTQYGYFETRMKMPPGPGTWPAFWLFAQKPGNQRDSNVEIDVIEYYGHNPSGYQSVVHVWFNDQTKKRGRLTDIHVPKDSLVEDFHTYGVDISPKSIVFFLDGKEVWRQPTPPELTYPMFPLVNLALGSGWPTDRTPNPSVLEVDYVRVYGRGPGPVEGCPAGPPAGAS